MKMRLERDVITQLPGGKEEFEQKVKLNSKKRKYEEAFDLNSSADSNHSASSRKRRSNEDLKTMSQTV